MKLQKFFKKYDIKYCPWAVKNRLSPSTVYRFLCGENISVKNLLLIQKACKNEVTVQDMIATK